MSDVLVAAVVLVLVALPVAVGAHVLRRLQARRMDRVADLEARGSVHTLDLPLLVGAILGFLGTALLGAGLLPMLVWLVDRDADAGRVALSAVVAFAVITTAAALVARRSWRFWVVEEDALVQVGPGSERRLRFADVERITVTRRLLPTMVVEGRAGARLRIPDQVDRSDLLLDLVLAHAPPGAWTGDVAIDAPSAFGDVATADGSTSVGRRPDPATFASWSLPRWRLVGPWVLLAMLLVFFLAWPWGLVEGDNPLVDSLAFVAIGVVAWSGIAALVVTTNFPRGQPLELHVRHDGIHLRRLRTAWEVLGFDEVVAVTVAPTIIYIRGFPGRRQPVMVLLTDDRVIEVGNDRQRHFATTAPSFARDLREALQAARGAPATPPPARDAGQSGNRPAPPDPAASAVVRAGAAADAGQWADAAGHLELAIAADPTGAVDARLLEAADLWRRAGRPDRAVALLHAHLDRAPDDAAGWERLAAAQRTLGHDELAQEATATAERLLLG